MISNDNFEEIVKNNKKVLNYFGLDTKKLEADVGKTFYSV
jgi:hypothetical protein